MKDDKAADERRAATSERPTATGKSGRFAPSGLVACDEKRKATLPLGLGATRPRMKDDKAASGRDQVANDKPPYAKKII